MRSAAALASALVEVAQVRYSRSGVSGRFAPSEPRFGTDRQQRQRLGHVVDRSERVQRTGCGKANFVNAGDDRRFDIFAAPGPRIPLPFTPGRNHFAPLQHLRRDQLRPIRSGKRSCLCRDLNALLKNPFQIDGSTISPIHAGRHRPCCPNSPQIMASVAVQCSPIPSQSITRSRPARRFGGPLSVGPCGKPRAGRKIARFKK